MRLKTRRETQYGQTMLLHKQNLSTRQIGRLVNTGSSTIQSWITGSRHPFRINHFDYNSRIQEYLDGLLLGDGCLSSITGHERNISPVYIQTFATRYKEWAEQIQRDFKVLGITSSIHAYDSNNGIKQIEGRKFIAPTISLATLHYYEFNLARRRWYLNGNKTLPSDLILTPLVILNWYLGDGCLYHHKAGNYRIILATQCFTDNELDYLCSQLKWQTGIVSICREHAINTKGNTLVINRRQDITKFLNYINGLNIPSCFQYKFDFKPKLEVK